ncbi:MAG: hypothetical protein A3B16_02325 [Candidatus Zambryskibacteria bacterium RIFCSPLOWO2_01_FULL_45_43]|uniref:Uncharacterized protein n=1 Tax=Candidatus Zambryskibacteria bacterium RIFCSPLOWO2_01_FULL_45_43 TaxID=1802762 RepID=A0A1G2UAB2_9BACT|nr:MAG: hypothetical protein A3B16_02325 [Candidatus Zambryskibacteria bacterium RIFCSPLOWO2_01_FULL_45_43]
MFHKYKLNDFVGVKLYFDAAEKKIGIKLVKEKAEGVFKLSKQAQGKGAYFTAHSFLSSLSIDPKKYAGRYEPEEVNDPEFGKLFVIQLAENAKDTS